MHSDEAGIYLSQYPSGKSLQNAKSVAILVAGCYGCLSGETR